MSVSGALVGVSGAFVSESGAFVGVRCMSECALCMVGMSMRCK